MPTIACVRSAICATTSTEVRVWRVRPVVRLAALLTSVKFVRMARLVMGWVSASPLHAIFFTVESAVPTTPLVRLVA